ncbi:putative glycosyltransferase [Wolffia australiana]
MKRKKRESSEEETAMEENRSLDRRSDGLGNLRILSDELICAVLNRLTPRDLGRLSCVSSVMYILCNEEPLWMSQCLRTPGPLNYMSSWKNTTLHRENLLNELKEHCEKRLKFDGFSSLYLYRRWYRCFTALDGFVNDNGCLERKQTLSADFSIDYSKPVLLTDLAKTWPARKTWTIDQLVQNYSDISFRISQRSSRKITMKLKDYVSYMSWQHDEDPLYIFDEKFGESAPSLLKDYTVPSFFREDYFDVLDEEKRPPFRWLIIGPARSGASWHVDPALTSAWNTLLVGRKRWALYPPGKVPAGVIVHVNEDDGDVDVETPSSLQWWLDIYPFLDEKDKPIECTQLPGETIFVPSGWWHCVLNLETTIAVTQNFVNASNFEFVCIDFCPGHLHKGVSRAGWLAVPEKFIANAKENDREYGRFNLEYHVNDNGFSKQTFSYDVDFLSKFLSDEVDHFTSTWGEGNSVGQREFREWLHRLWILRPEVRPLIWKGACLALKTDRWLARVLEICSSNNIPRPFDEEKLPVGTGSNPVYLVSDYVIKLYVEGGLALSLYSLGTELEFYSLLHAVRSPLSEYVPEVLCSGVLVQQPDGSCKNCSWSGRRIHDIIENLSVGNCTTINDDYSLGIWAKMEFSSRKDDILSTAKMWPYLITKRCRGSLFSDIRERISLEDNLSLASFLGEQLRNLHLLPVPKFASYSEDSKNVLLEKDTEMIRKVVAIDNVVEHVVVVGREWKSFISGMEQRKKDISNRLVQWGDPIPKVLIEKVEEYIPEDPLLLIGLFKEEDDMYRCSSPSWVHTDVMDDNIYMHQITEPSLTTEGRKEKWFPTHIIDFTDLLIGDPLLDLIPIHIDVFRTDATLLKRFLDSYKFPLRQNLRSDGDANQKKFERASYRAMCYCILHEDNVLGTIFSLRKDLRSATTWEEVETGLWEELNTIKE